MSDKVGQTQQLPVSVWFKGPEYGFVIRQGDLAALERAMAVCSDFWNGANSLIIPVDSRGKTWPMVAQHLEIHPVEVALCDPGLDEERIERLRRSLGSKVSVWSRWTDRSVERELSGIHPGWGPEGLPQTLEVPRFGTRRQRRIAMACWGIIGDGVKHFYQQQVGLNEVSGVAAHRACLTGQIDRVSPLELSLRGIRSYQTNANFERVLLPIESGSFNELVHFWNQRSRSRSHGDSPLLIGLDAQAMTAEVLEPLADWISSEWMDVEPDLGLWMEPGNHVKQLMRKLGFAAHAGKRIRTTFSRRKPDRPLSYGFFAPSLGERSKRGIVAPAQVTFVDGQASFMPPRPVGFGPRSVHYIRLAVEGLPLPVPPTDAVAAATMTHALATPEGISVKTGADAANGYLHIALPDPWTGLAAWAGGHGYSIKRSDSGRYGQALLDRLGGLPALGPLRSDPALGVLSALAPLSRKKLAQRVVAEARDRTGARTLDEQLLAELIAQHVAVGELPARTVDDLMSTASLTRTATLTALEALVEAGFVRRTAAVRCSQCGFKDHIGIRDLDERIVCRACQQPFLLAVSDGQGKERPWAYQLDGLMARAMDQDLLPELLTVRVLADTQGPVRTAFTGVEFRSRQETIEIDAVMANGSEIFLGEAKLTAQSLTVAQTDRLVRLCAKTGARPVLSALNGSFAHYAVEQVEPTGLTFLRGDLLGG